MLNKLLKHEFKATARFFLPVYIIFAALLIVQRLSLVLVVNVNSEIQLLNLIIGFVSGLLTLITVLSLIAMLACPLVYAMVRFWKNMTGDEGYLTHTLPVTTGKNILAKLIASEAWFVVTAVFTILCGLLYLLSMDAAGLGRFFRELGIVWDAVAAYGAAGWAITILVLIVLAILTQLANNLLTVFDAMSIGQTANKHKLLASGGAYIGIMTATSFLLQAVMLGVVFLFGEQIFLHMERISITPATPNIAAAVPQLAQFLCGVMLLAILANCALTALHFFLSRHFLSKKLNLA